MKKITRNQKKVLKIGGKGILGATLGGFAGAAVGVSGIGAVAGATYLGYKEYKHKKKRPRY